MFFLVFPGIPIVLAIKYLVADRRYRRAIERVAGFQNPDAHDLLSGRATMDSFRIFGDLNRIAGEVRAGKHGGDVAALLSARNRWFFLCVGALPTCVIGAFVAQKLLGW